MGDVRAPIPLPEQGVGHGHTDDTLEALHGHAGGRRQVLIADRVAIHGDELENSEPAEPVEAGNVLEL